MVNVAASATDMEKDASIEGGFGFNLFLVYRGDSNLAKVQLNINSKALVAHIDRVV